MRAKDSRSWNLSKSPSSSFLYNPALSVPNKCLPSFFSSLLYQNWSREKRQSSFQQEDMSAPAHQEAE